LFTKSALLTTATLISIIKLLLEGNNTGESVCTKCGASIDTGLIFCKKCGTTLRPPLPLVAPAPQSPHTRVSVFADAIGLILIPVQLTLVFWWLVPDDGTRFIVGIIAYGVLVTVALFMWYGREASRFSDASDCVGALLGSILLGRVSFGIDVLIGSSEYPGISPKVCQLFCVNGRVLFLGMGARGKGPYPFPRPAM
jgi:hypothetical protein